MNTAKQCSCGNWWSDTGVGHTGCKDCRVKQKAGRQRKIKYKAKSSQQRLEENGGLIGGYETDETYCPD